MTARQNEAETLQEAGITLPTTPKQASQPPKTAKKFKTQTEAEEAIEMTRSLLTPDKKSGATKEEEQDSAK